jgi:predicted ribosome quality control (RQC) complex YloA/Tae2 family protein
MTDPRDDIELLRADTARTLQTARKRVARKCDAIRQDLARVEEARELARIAALATPTIGSVKRGTKSIEVVDYASGEPKTHVIALDPSKSPREGLERIFSNARRMRRGMPVATERLNAAERELARLDAAIAAVMAAEDEDALLEARKAAKLPSPKAAAKKPLQEKKPPFRTFTTPRGTILVGRGAGRNDELTFHHSKPYHLWLHARGVPGAHVIVQLRRDQDCPSELLVDAAHLAAHFSDARGERIVEVTHVPRKFVRKPKGSAPGAVVVEREKVLALRFDDAHLARLLASEVDQNA